MKRMLPLGMLVLGWGLLKSIPSLVLGIPTSALPQAELRQGVWELVAQGYEVYHYDDRQIIAGSPDQVYPGSKILCAYDSSPLYLIDKTGDKHLELDPSTGRILLELGSSYLLQSDLDPGKLRRRISGSITRLELSPLKMNQVDALLPELRETRIDILSLVSQVNADSVFAYIQHLQDFQTRYASADNRWEVAAWIKDQYIRLGLSGAYLHSYFWNGLRQFNPVAKITGSVYPDVYILVGGHHDSTTGSNPLLYAPGADDNASGAAATIEMARVIQATGFVPRCSIILTTFSAEEVGHYGSLSYVQQALADSMDIRLMINLDMLANNEPGNTMVHLVPYDGCIGHSLNAANITALYTALEPEFWNLNAVGSDSYSFWQAGYNVIFFNEYNYSPFWHTDEDTTLHIDADYCAELIRGVLATAAIYASLPLAPQNPLIQDTGSGSSLLASWTPSPDPLVTGYRVYLGTSEYELGFWQQVTDTECLLSGLDEGRTYYMGVSAVDIAGNESYQVLAQGASYATPFTPRNLTDQPQLHAIQLGWSPNSELDLAGYRIYRSLDQDDSGTLIATITAPQTAYLDQNLNGIPGYYFYRISAIDHSGLESPLSPALSSRPVTLDQGILIIDETLDYTGASPFQPTDEMVDDFYASLLQGYGSTAELDLEDLPQRLRLADIGIYSSLLWHGNDVADLSYPASVRELLRQYLSLGGNVLFSVYFPSTAFELGGSYPVFFPEMSFINEVLGIAQADYNLAARFRYALPGQAWFPLLEVDSTKTIPSFAGHIFRVEGMQPNSWATAVYSYGSDYPSQDPQGSLNGESVGVLSQYGEGKTLTLSFPLYHIRQDHARWLARYVFGTLFAPASPVTETANEMTGVLRVLPNRPNPFDDRSNFRVQSEDREQPLRLAVYNLRGQLVQELYRGKHAPENEYCWDGRDAEGRKAPSGVYILHAVQNGRSHSRKILLIN